MRSYFLGFFCRGCSLIPEGGKRIEGRLHRVGMGQKESVVTEVTTLKTKSKWCLKSGIVFFAVFHGTLVTFVFQIIHISYIKPLFFKC